MSVWEAYDNQVEARGATRREAILSREKRRLSEKLRNSLSYFSVEIGDYTYMDKQNVSIANSDNLNEKFIFALPDEDIACGSLVHWMDNYWLVTEKDANVEVYTRCKMIQCNYLLKWVDEDHLIQEQWCVVEDGTKLEHTPGVQWFGILETVCKNYSLNCWNPLRAMLATA